MAKRPGANKENLEETRRIFLEIAYQEFCEFGYTDASTSRIVERSGMARGSLYYHFGDKNGLFKAVYEHTMESGLEAVSDVMEEHSDPWQAFKAGSHAFLKQCLDKNFRKVVLIESQAAMTFEERLAIQEKTLLGKLRTLLPALLENGYFPGHSPRTAAIFIFGILGEIGRAFDSSHDIENDMHAFSTAYDETMKRLTPQAA